MSFESSLADVADTVRKLNEGSTGADIELHFSKDGITIVCVVCRENRVITGKRRFSCEEAVGLIHVTGWWSHSVEVLQRDMHIRLDNQSFTGVEVFPAQLHSCE